MEGAAEAPHDPCAMSGEGQTGPAPGSALLAGARVRAPDVRAPDNDDDDGDDYKRACAYACA